MKNNVKEIAKYIISSCYKEGEPVNNYQLQRIIYILQAKHLEKYGEVLFDDNIIAYQFGPVTPPVYHQYIGFGSMDLTFEYESTLSKDIEKFIDSVVEENRMRHPWGMGEDIDGTGTLWLDVYDNGNGEYKVIPVSSLYATVKVRSA